MHGHFAHLSTLCLLFWNRLLNMSCILSPSWSHHKICWISHCVKKTKCLVSQTINAPYVLSVDITVSTDFHYAQVEQNVCGVMKANQISKCNYILEYEMMCSWILINCLYWSSQFMQLKLRRLSLKWSSRAYCSSIIARRNVYSVNSALLKS